MATHLEPYLATNPVYGNQSAPVSANWYTIDPAAAQWYGMKWTASTPFKHLTFRMRNTASPGVSANYRFQLHKGGDLDAPMVFSTVVTITGTTATTGIDIRVDMPSSVEAGLYHFRLTYIDGAARPNVQLGRTTNYTGGNALYADPTTGALVQSTQDLVFSYWDSVDPGGEYIGSDSTPSSRGLSSAGAYSGMEFTTPKNVKEMHFALQMSGNANTGTFRVVIHRGSGALAPVVWDSGYMGVTMPTVKTVYWVPVVIPELLPAGDYQFRLYGTGMSFSYSAPSTGGDISNSIESSNGTTQLKPGYYQIAHRVLLTNAASENAPKRWNGMEWIGTNPKRWDGVQWVGANLTPIKPSPRRFYDVDSLMPLIDQSNVESMFGLQVPMAEVYGVAVTRYRENSTYNGYDVDAITADPDALENFKIFVYELGKYTPEFTKSASRIKQLVMAPNLRDSGYLGGIAFDTSTGMAFVNTVRATESSIGKFRNIDFLIHHELHHLMNFSWTSEINALKTEWTGLNVGGGYLGNNYATIPSSPRPQGYLRTYGRSSFLEDTADIFGSMMATSHQEFLAEVMAEDPIVYKKVMLLRKWFATKDPEFGNIMYWTSIHTPHTA